MTYVNKELIKTDIIKDLKYKLLIFKPKLLGGMIRPRPSSLGGSINLRFLNSNGTTTGIKNIHK